MMRRIQNQWRHQVPRRLASLIILSIAFGPLERDLSEQIGLSFPEAVAEVKRDSDRYETWREEGKTLYKDRDYQGAVRIFIKLVQHQATSYADYLLLARSANRAEDYLVSSVAYQIYLASKTGKNDRQAKTEHQEVKRQLKGGVDVRKRNAHKARVEEVLHLIKRGELLGDKGAIVALNDLHKDQIFDPLLQRAHQRLEANLFKGTELRLHTALKGTEEERASLDLYLKGIRQWGQSSWGDRSLAEKEALILDAFSMVHRDPEKTLKMIEEITRSGAQPSPHLLRSLQLLALSKLNRHEEVYLMVNGLLSSLEGRLYGDQGTEQEQQRVKRLRAIKGTYGRALKKEDSTDDLVHALLSPSERAKELTKQALAKLKSSEKSSENK